MKPKIDTDAEKTDQTTNSPAVVKRRFVRPAVGDVWAFGSLTGRPVTITRISFGAAGSWGMVDGKLTHTSGPRRRLYVQAKGAVSQCVSSWLGSWVFIRRANAQDKPLAASPRSVSAERFVSDYADDHLYEAGEPRGMCNDCQHYRPAINYSEEDTEDWCWLKEGAYADGRENECPAWIASQNAEVSQSNPLAPPSD